MSATQETIAPVIRPTSATVISWLWILLGVGTFFSAIEAVLASRKFAAARPDLRHDVAGQAKLDAIANYIGGTPVEFFVLTLVSIIAIVGGVGLLKLRAWGWRTLTVCSWLMFVGSLTGLPYCLWMLVDSANQAADAFDTIEIFLFSVALLQLAFNALIAGFMLRSLHGERIRGAVTARGEMRGHLD